MQQLTEQQYLEQNLKGFESDTFAREKINQIIIDKDIQTVIETGTYLGSTTRVFSEWVNEVHTIESSPISFAKAKETLNNYNNIWMYLGSSPEVLDDILPKIKYRDRIKGVSLLCFLDAHWGQYLPLLDELAVIAKHEIKPKCIIIHDFFNPNHPELGYDTYNDKALEWSYIEAAITKIYGENYVKEYNSEATGAMRGIVYIYPKV